MAHTRRSLKRKVNQRGRVYSSFYDKQNIKRRRHHEDDEEIGDCIVVDTGHGEVDIDLIGETNIEEESKLPFEELIVAPTENLVDKTIQEPIEEPAKEKIDKPKLIETITRPKGDCCPEAVSQTNPDNTAILTEVKTVGGNDHADEGAGNVDCCSFGDFAPQHQDTTISGPGEILEKERLVDRMIAEELKKLEDDEKMQTGEGALKPGATANFHEIGLVTPRAEDAPTPHENSPNTNLSSDVIQVAQTALSVLGFSVQPVQQTQASQPSIPRTSSISSTYLPPNPRDTVDKTWSQPQMMPSTDQLNPKSIQSFLMPTSCASWSPSLAQPQRPPTRFRPLVPISREDRPKQLPIPEIAAPAPRIIKKSGKISRMTQSGHNPPNVDLSKSCLQNHAIPMTAPEQFAQTQDNNVLTGNDQERQLSEQIKSWPSLPDTEVGDLLKIAQAPPATPATPRIVPTIPTISVSTVAADNVAPLQRILFSPAKLGQCSSPSRSKASPRPDHNNSARRTNLKEAQEARHRPGDPIAPSHHNDKWMNVVTDDFDRPRTSNDKERLRNRATEFIARRTDVELEEDEVTGGPKRVYPQVYGCIVDKFSAKGIVAVTARGVPVQQVDTGQSTVGKPYAELIIGAGQTCMIYGSSTVLYYRPRKPPISLFGSSTPLPAVPQIHVSPPPEMPRIPQIITPHSSPRPVEITIRVQVDEEGRFSNPYPFSIWRQETRIADFFTWFPKQGQRAIPPASHFLTFTLKDSMPDRISRTVTMRDGDDFSLMRTFVTKQFEKARGFLPELMEFVVLVSDPEWVPRK